jgi:hypothetical protein
MIFPKWEKSCLKDKKKEGFISLPTPPKIKPKQKEETKK